MDINNFMEILHLNTYDIRGGAALGAYSIHKGLVSAGLDSKMLVQTKESDDCTVIGSKHNTNKFTGLLRPYFDKLPLSFYSKRKSSTFYPAIIPDNISATIQSINPDIINLHWVAGGFFQIESLRKFNKPIVWTLRDMWGFTGGCHFSEGCLKYQESCEFCPILNSDTNFDLSKLVWKRKHKTYKDLNLTVVTLSNWLKDCSQNSSLFKDVRVEVIPNGFDLNIFKPIDKKVARDILSLPQDKTLILFGAIKSLNDERKGLKYLLEALNILSEKEKFKNAELVIFGSSKPEKDLDLKFPVNYMGYLHDYTTLALLYSAVDIMIVPSQQESFGKTAAEAMACGTPVAAFAVTGLLDIIDHKINGYLAKPFDSNDLATGIDWILSNNGLDKPLSIQARKKVEKEFNIKNVANKYLELYQSILK